MAVWRIIDALAADVTHYALQRLYVVFVRPPKVCARKRAREIVRRQSLDRHHQRLRPRWRFVLHAKSLPGNFYDGHTLGSVIAALGSNLRRVLAWLKAPLRLILLALWPAFAPGPALRSAS